MTQEQLRNLNTIVETYGKEPQIDMAIEECSELTKALLKYRRKKNGCNTPDEEKELVAAVVDEIADVQIMITQLQIIFECMAATEERVDFKINRQMNRIRKRGSENVCEVAGRNDCTEQ